jgi:hypothetical protein
MHGERELTHVAEVNSRRSILEISVGNEQNVLGKKHNSKNNPH